MVEIAEQDTAVETIEATVNYIMDDGTKIFTLTGEPGTTDADRRHTGPAPHHSQRPVGADRLALDREGYRFIRHDTKVVDFFDEDEVRRVYYPEMEALVKAESGASRVVVFDHTLRTADDELRETAQDPRGRAPRAQRLHRMVGPAAGARPACRTRPTSCSRRRFAIIQVWRPIRHPVESWPLAICRRAEHLARRSGGDRAPLSRPHRPDLRHHLQSRRTAGTGSRACGATRRWSSRSTISLKDGRARWTAHTAFDDPTTAARCAAAREHRNPHTRFFLKYAHRSMQRRKLAMLTRRQVLASSAAGLVCAGTSFVPRALAQVIKKPVHIIASDFRPAAAPSILARILADRLRGPLRSDGRLVENKPGASARIAVEYVKNAGADGSVLLFTPDFPMTIYPPAQLPVAETTTRSRISRQSRPRPSRC